jgi:hypothetical protein
MTTQEKPRLTARKVDSCLCVCFEGHRIDLSQIDGIAIGQTVLLDPAAVRASIRQGGPLQPQVNTRDWGGANFYVPRDFGCKRSSNRDQVLYGNFNGRNHQELAIKYGLSIRHVYKIILRCRDQERRDITEGMLSGAFNASDDRQEQDRWLLNAGLNLMKDLVREADASGIDTGRLDSQLDRINALQRRVNAFDSFLR